MLYDTTGSTATLNDSDDELHFGESNVPDIEASSQTLRSVKLYNNSDSPADQTGLFTLHEIIRGGSPHCAEQVDVLLSSTIVDVNGVAPSGGCTALHLAAQLNDNFEAEEVAFQLLKHGADPSIKDMSLRTAGDYAFCHGHGHLGHYLSFGGMTVNAAIAEIRRRRADHFSAHLLKAAKCAKVDDVRMCLELGANPNALNKHGVGALHFAIARCPADRRSVIVEMLINGGADVNLRDQEGDTALNLLIKCGHNDEDGKLATLAKYLLDKGTNIAIKDLDGKDATMLAAERKFDDIVSLLPGMHGTVGPIQNNGTNTLPNNKVVRFQTDDVTSIEIMTEDTTPNATSPDDAINEDKSTGMKESTLHRLYAALKNGTFSEIMQHLNGNKDNIDTPDEDDNASIHLAVLRVFDEHRKLIIKELLQHGASVNIQRQSDGHTGLHLAVEKNNKMAVEVLLEAKPDITITSQQGETPHQTAIRLKHTEISEMIKKYRVEKNMALWQKKARWCLIL